MTATFQLVAVAFLRSTGGRVRVLLAIDRDGEQLFDGEPALLLEHRPGAPAGTIELETADRIRASAIDVVHAAVAAELAQLVEDAHDEFGQLDGERLLGRSAEFSARADTFDM
ncbi:MAG: hypothetical protein JWL76_1348 [Thermoleophilia bacterium]|nr:hypothetical protein [Thermoleophilia bacterium]